MLSCLLTLSSCSTKIETVTEYQKQYITSELLVVNCTEYKYIDSVRTLAVGYLSEKSCRKAYEELVEGIKKSYTKEGLDNEHADTK